MSFPVLQATISACVLTATSNILAQCITAYRNNRPYTIDWSPVLQFILFTALNSPPNFLWQEFLESTFPSHAVRPSQSAIAAAATDDERELDREEAEDQLIEARLNVANTVWKFVLDQSIGAALNTIAFSLAMAAFRGADWSQATQAARQEFWPIMAAGWKLWPFVCLANYTLVRSVQMRSLVGNLAGVGWNVYLSLVAGGR